MNKEAFFAGFLKAAYEGAQKHEVNQFAAATRRDLSDSEHADIAKAKQKVMPKLFSSMADPLHSDMSSPAWSGGILGAGGALGGAALGASLGGEDNLALRAILGALAGGGLGGLVGYKGRSAANASVEEAMRKLPPGATRDDFLRDPRVQADMNRQTALLSSGNYGQF